MARRVRHTVRYAFDEANRLLIRRREGSGAWQVAERLEGRIEVDRKNRLLYVVEPPEARDGRQAIQLEGSWRLTAGQELALTLHDTRTAGRQTLYLKGAVTDAGAHRLVFTLAERGTEGAVSGRRIALSGRWAADANNRLTFLAERSGGAEDRLTLEGGWEMDRHHTLLYRHRRQPGEQPAAERTMVFDGAWDVTGAARLTYRLAGSDTSAFEFRGAVQSRSLMARSGQLVYQIGIEAGGRRERRRVALFGTWKLGRDRSVAFEIPYRGGRVQAVRFLGAVTASSRDQIQVALSAARNRPVGVTVTFTRKLTPDAALFLEWRGEQEPRGVFGGVRVRF